MGPQRPETDPPREQDVDVLSSRLPVADASPSFDAFYLGEIGRLVSLATGLCGRAQAEDVAQEAMVVTFRRWREIGQRDHPAAFARRVCANLAVSAFRRRLVEVRALVRLTDRSWARNLDATQNIDSAEGDDREFWAHVCALPRRQAQAVALRYVYGLPVAEIADTLGISEGSAKVHLHRGRLSLAARLGDSSEETS